MKITGLVHTLNDTDQAIHAMEQRLKSDQGDITSAMCRLSFGMSKGLRMRFNCLLRACHKQRDRAIKAERRARFAWCFFGGLFGGFAFTTIFLNL